MNNTINNNNNKHAAIAATAIDLPLNLQSIFIGIMLSDGSLYKSSPSANARFEMSFGENYKDLAYHIGELFKDFMNNPVKPLTIKGIKKEYINYRFKTKSLPLFNAYYDMFYKLDIEKNKYVKIVPTNIKDYMNPEVLAYLIQGDGNYDKNRKRVRIYTNSYKKSEVENLALAINTTLNLKVSVLHDRKDQ